MFKRLFLLVCVLSASASLTVLSDAAAKLLNVNVLWFALLFFGIGAAAHANELIKKGKQ